ncbi:endonuclease/exonuclease/phosphatase family metal-dependent hydrolase [Actinoplanes digitatis]|uniref:Endonuclease/exonuclease/phosphatase family metal-dependent hydrolase n=1 Tax=Actinoplanes digitatis TaxID=1868 RepID=A0A7W7I6K0_9ACTN|nr:endonuclease/exonuclease/phosphatase family metal-dependent hydrolase [Actinoplanes digitatis]
MAAVLLSVALPTSALAETTTPGDPNGRAFASDAIKAITWNMCGEGGGSTPAKSGYCPDRNKPQAKADALGKLVRSRGANVVLLQEVCAGTLNNAERGKSLLTLIQENLGSEWSFEWEPTTRAGGSPETHCRGALSGTYATAIGVRGTIASHDSTSLQQPMPDGHLSIPAGQEWSYVLCAKVTGWQTRICNAHLTNYDKVSNPDAPPLVYSDQVGIVRNAVAGYPWVLLGGDFNTTSRDALQPLYSLMPECDQQSYYTNDGGDASNETTYHGYLGVTADSDGKIVSYTNSDIKIDYLFSTAGFAQCDSRTSLADHADYHGTVQPDCSTKRDPAVCQPTGVSDHAPLYGELKGSASLAYQLRETSGVTATDSSANHHDGSLEPGVTWNTAEAAATFDGTGEITGPEAVLGTTYGFSISAWVKVAPGSSTVAAVSQDGTEISGFILWYEADDKTWRFGMPTGDTTGWRVDRAVSTSQAQPGVWTHLTGVHDQRNNLLTLYVNGRKAGQAAHLAPWPAKGPFVVGRDKVNGRENAFWTGSIRDVRVFGYPLNDAQANNLASS